MYMNESSVLERDWTDLSSDHEVMQSFSSKAFEEEDYIWFLGEEERCKQSLY